MLTAYFDDSGTHDASAALVMAGWIGDEEQWAKFDKEWRALLDKEGLTWFHMTECEAADGEFDMWPRPRRDALIHDLRQVILNNNLHGLGVVIARNDWNRLVTGKIRDILGDGNDVCFVHAIDLATRWVRVRTNHYEMAFVFDIGVESNEKHLIIQTFDENYNDIPEIQSITFARVKQFSPLQAADMLAWESYHRALQIFNEGSKANPRAHFQRFLDENSIYGEILDGEMIKKEVDRRTKKQ